MHSHNTAKMMFMPTLEDAPAKDLWQAAFDKLDQKEQHILQPNNGRASTNGQKDELRTKDVIDKVIESTKQEYKEYQERGGIKIKRSVGEAIDLRQLSWKIINAALSFKEIIGVGAACDPTGHAASAWTIVSLGLTMAKNHSDRRDALFDSSEYLADVLARCAYIQQNFYGEQSEERGIVGQATIRVYKAILQYAAKVLACQNLGLIEEMLDNVTAITNQQLTQLQSSIEKEKQELYQLVQLAQFDKLEKNDKAAEDMLAAIDDKLSKSLDALILKSGLPIAEGAAFDSYANRSNATCFNETRVNVRCQISAWAESPTSKCIFWLNGMAGTGKSAIAQTMAQTFQEKGQLAASFFFKKGEADRDNAEKFIPTIVRQLMAHDQLLARNVLTAIENDSAIAKKRLPVQFAKLLLQPLQALAPNKNKVLVVVIDALDECEQEDVKVLLQHLPDVGALKSLRLRILVTSRPELPIQSGFGANNTYQELVLHQVPEQDIKHDIRLFLVEGFATIRKKSKLLADDWPGKASMEKLVEKSVPLFIYAATVCGFIGDGFDLPEERLEVVLQSEISSPATQMEDLYRPVLERILNPKSDTESKRIEKSFCDIIGPLILLYTPLSIHTLGQFLDLPPNRIRLLLEKLHSVINISRDPEDPDEMNSSVRILHLSFREYLLTTEERFHVDEEKTHAKMASHCLRIMNQKLKHNICELPSYGSNRKHVQRQILDQHISADLQYSCRYWINHLEQCDGHISELEISTFLKKHLLHWLEAMSLMGIISEAVGIMDRLQSGQKSSIGSDFPEFLNDAKRFILKNVYIVDTAPLQLYCSGLVFSPMQSIVKKTFQDERPRKISVLPQVQNTWSVELQTLEGHSGRVQSVAFSPNGRTVASGSTDDTTKLWDASTGKEQQTLTGHSQSVESVAFSPDGRIVASGSTDHTTKLWDTNTGKELRTLIGHSKSVFSIAFSPLNGRILASGSGDTTIKLWNLDTGKEFRTLKGHSNSVCSIAFSPLDGRILASGSDDKTIKLWNLDTGNELQTLRGHPDWVHSVAFSLDGRTVASGSAEIIKLWNPHTGSELQTLRGHSRLVQSIAFSSDGRTVASGSDDATIKLWNPDTGIELQTLKGHSRPVQSVAFSSDGRTVASGSDDKTIKLWDTNANAGKDPQTINNHSERVQSITVSPDGRMVASSSVKIIKLWDALTGKELQTLEGHSQFVRCIVFSPDSRIVASGSADGTTKLWNASTGMVLQTLDHSDWVESIAFFPDGRTVISASQDKTVKLWDANTGEELQTLEGHSADSVQSMAGQIPQKDSHPVSLADRWVYLRGKKLLWLPFEYCRWTCFAIEVGTLAIGYSDGKILILNLRVD
ncbi:hypothetical protein N7485_012245 [Penicillium canescens]|nr:hypothetical protein N7485_012245 [Penicillium canescens]